jgi:hypothetical protein
MKDSQRKAMFAKLKNLPTQFRRWEHKREVKKEHDVERDIKETEKKLTQEQEMMHKRLELERKMAVLRKEQEELANLKRERFQSSTLGRGLTNLGQYAKKGLITVRDATQQQSRPARTYKRKGRKRDSDDGEITFGGGW